MATFGQLKERVAQRVDVTNLDTEIGVAINDTIQKLNNSEILFFNTAYVTNRAFTADAETFTDLPADFLFLVEPGGFVVENNDINWPMEELHNREFDAQDVGAAGIPRYYTVRASTIYVYPKPDDAYTAKLNYVKTYSDLAADGSTNDWTNNAAELIIAKTVADVYIDQRKSPDRFAFFNDKAAMELGYLKQRTRERLGTGRLAVRSLAPKRYKSTYYDGHCFN